MATSVFLLPTTRRLGNGSIVVAKVAVVNNKERRRSKTRLAWRLLRETCACDVAIVLASATKQVMYSKKELERSGLTSTIPSCGRTQGRLFCILVDVWKMRFSFSTSTVAGAVNAGGVRLPALFLLFFKW